MQRRKRLLAALTLALAATALPGRAADHRDGPAATADPAADIADVYVWMSGDASKMNLVMTLGRNLGPEAAFSDQVLYVFHTTSKPTFGDPGAGVDEDIVCEFDAQQRVKCWAGGQSIAGNASVPGGIERNGMRVFTGLRNDPFFFNLSGFSATAKAVAAAAPSLTFDGAGCPTLDAATASALVKQLRSKTDGTPAVDEFLDQNLLALVVQVDASVVTRGGPIVAVWGSTHRR